MLSILMLQAVFPVPETVANDALPEYTVKAGFLYNFAMLTDWPPKNLGATLDICVMGNQDLLQALSSIHGKVVNNRRIDVVLLEKPEEAKECHVLFLTESDRVAELKALREITGLPVLTVTDDESVARTGAIIFLRPERQRIVFEINMAAAKNANLNISSRLLRLARAGVSE